MKGILKGMNVTIRHVFHKPVTEEYPYVKRISKNYRGLHVVYEKKCTVCRVCENSCPNRSIKIELKNGKQKSKSISDYNYTIDIGKCMWCGLCAEVCPFKAIEMTPEFELSTYDKKNLIYNPVIKFSKNDI